MLEGPRQPYNRDTYSYPQHDAHTLRILAIQRARSLYERQLMKARLLRTISFLVPLSLPLLDLDEIMSRSPLVASRAGGVQPVPLSAIQGTQGRTFDFDRSFRPIRRHTLNRWVNIAALRLMFTPLPVVELIQVEEVFFVRDGHHRISVARALGEVEIDSQITTYQLHQPLEAILQPLKAGSGEAKSAPSMPKRSTSQSNPPAEW